MKKKFASLFLVMALVLTMIPASAFATTGVANNTFTIDQEDATYEIGEPIMVTANSDVDGAWVGLYQAGDDTSSVTSYWWYYVNGSYGGKSWTNGETYNIYNTVSENGRGGYSDYRGLVEAGKYKLVLFYGDQSVSKEIEVTYPADTTTSVEVEKDTYTVGETVKVKSNAYAWGDWVGIYKTTYTDLASVPSSGYEDYHYAVGHNGLWFEYPSLGEGEYTAVLWSNEGADATAMDTFTVVEGEEPGDEPGVPAGPVVATDKATYEYGEPIMVTTNYKTTDNDWVGIWKKGTYPTGTSYVYYYIQAASETNDINTETGTNLHRFAVQDASCFSEEGKLLAGEYTIAVCKNNLSAADGGGVESVDITVVGGPAPVDPYEDYAIEFEAEETLPADKVITDNNLPGLEFYDMLTVGFKKGIPMKVTVPADLDVSEGAWVGMYDAIGGECMVYQYLRDYAPVENGDTKTYEFDFAEGWKPGAASGKEKEYGYRQFVLYTAETGAVAKRVYFWARQDASGAAVVLDQDTFTYDGQAHQPTIKTAAGKDSVYWTATVPSNTNAGVYNFPVTFRYKFGGSTTGTYTILQKNVADADVAVAGIGDVTANGSAFKPVPDVTYNGMTLVEGTDYDVAYGENTKPGKGTITITGKGNYTGERVVEFNIIEKVCNHVWDAGVMTTPDTCTTVGVKTFTCTLDKNHTRTENVDVIKDHAWDAGTMTKADTCTEVGVKTFVCKNDGSHKKTENVDVIKAHAFGEAVVTKAPTCTAGGQKVATCTYGCGEQQVTAIAKAAHTIVDVPAVEATCTATGLTAGKQCSVCGTWTLAQGTVDKLAHTVATSEITKKATAKADGEITNKCACGEIVGTTPIAKAVVTLSKTGAVYTGKVVKAPVVRVKDANGKTIAKTNYTIVAPKNVKKMKDIGRYAYTIKFKGDTYTGSVKVNFEIKPAKTKIKAPAAAKKAITVKWTKAAKKEKVTGYEVMYATNNKFTKGKKQITVKGAAKVSKKVTKLKSKTKYFVKVRSYKTVKGVKIYSDWSAVKSIKAK